MRCTVSLLTPKRLANLRHDQWVEPSLRPLLIAANIRACSLGVRTDGFWPGCRSSISPAILLRAKSLLPTRDSRSRGIQNLLDLPVRDALAQQQHHARSHHITCRKTPRLRHLLQFLSLCLAHNNRSTAEWHVHEALILANCYSDTGH